MSDVLKLHVDRYLLMRDRVVGRLYVDGGAFGFTLEDPPRDVKIPGITGIPSGTYKIRMRTVVSERFGRKMPELLDVPGFTDILLHWGNYPKDTRGCLLVGMRVDPLTLDLRDSRMAFDRLVKRIEENEALRGPDACEITISQSFNRPTPEVM